MILFASRAFSSRFKCGQPIKGVSVLHGQRPDSWSVHLFRLGRIEASIFMNDASLFSFVIPTKGARSLDDLLGQFSIRLNELHASMGIPFTASDQVLVLPRSNRSRIGSMNDAINCMKQMHAIRSDSSAIVDWSDLEEGINRMPFKALDYDRPIDVMPDVVKALS